jgi:hypothetical protein
MYWISAAALLYSWSLWKISTNSIIYLVARCMAGLTPVSALIHAAMVTAGIFMIMRLNCFDLSDVQNIIAIELLHLL